MESVRKSKHIVEYALIVAMFYLTGGAFSYTNYSLKTISFFFISAAFCVYYGYIKKGLNGRTVAVCLIQLICLILVPLFNNEGASSYFAIMLILWSGMFCAVIIPIEEFKRKYINVITFFAVVSLIAMVISVVYPQFVLIFPKIEGGEDASVDYYNAGIHVFMQAKTAVELRLTIRNNGICWEPGCYQAFLNVGLIFLLERQNDQADKKFLLKFSILVMTVLTTGSTTGILIVLLILAVYFKTWFQYLGSNRRGIISAVIVIVAAMFILKELDLLDFFTNKLQNEFDEEALFLDRISLDKLDYLFSDGTFWFFGMGFERWLTYDQSLWNSIIHSFLCLGIPFTLLQISMYMMGSKKLVKHYILLFIVLMMCFSTETLFWRAFFSSIAFYGIVEEN